MGSADDCSLASLAWIFICHSGLWEAIGSVRQLPVVETSGRSKRSTIRQFDGPE
jgi:hypothetical protein